MGMTRSQSNLQLLYNWCSALSPIGKLLKLKTSIAPSSSFPLAWQLSCHSALIQRCHRGSGNSHVSISLRNRKYRQITADRFIKTLEFLSSRGYLQSLMLSEIFHRCCSIQTQLSTLGNSLMTYTMWEQPNGKAFIQVIYKVKSNQSQISTKISFTRSVDVGSILREIRPKCSRSGSSRWMIKHTHRQKRSSKITFLKHRRDWTMKQRKSVRKRRCLKIIVQ